MKVYHQYVAAIMLATLIVTTCVVLLLRPKQDEEVDRGAAVQSRCDKTTERLRSVLKYPDTLVVHGVREWDYDVRTEKVVEVQFSAQGIDGELYRSNFQRYYLRNGTTMDGFPTHKDFPNAVIYDPHKLFNVEP